MIYLLIMANALTPALLELSSLEKLAQIVINLVLDANVPLLNVLDALQGISGSKKDAFKLAPMEHT